MADLKAEIASLFAVARRAGADNKPGDPEDFADLVLAIPEIAEALVPWRDRVLMVLGGERDNMPPEDVKTIQRFVANA